MPSVRFTLWSTFQSCRTIFPRSWRACPGLSRPSTSCLLKVPQEWHRSPWQSRIKSVDGHDGRGDSISFERALICGCGQFCDCWRMAIRRKPVCPGPWPQQACCNALPSANSDFAFPVRRTFPRGGETPPQGHDNVLLDTMHPTRLHLL